MKVEVAHALPEEQTVISVNAPEGSTVMAVIELSGILNQYPQINLTQQPVGIFGQIVSLETRVEDQDRVEIYRPLIRDPMETRRARAKEQRKRDRS